MSVFYDRPRFPKEPSPAEAERARLAEIAWQEQQQRDERERAELWARKSRERQEKINRLYRGVERAQRVEQDLRREAVRVLQPITEMREGLADDDLDALVDLAAALTAKADAAGLVARWLMEAHNAEARIRT